MESKALLAIALWLCVETGAASGGKEPTPQKDGGEVGRGRETGDAERSCRPACPGTGEPERSEAT